MCVHVYLLRGGGERDKLPIKVQKRQHKKHYLSFTFVLALHTHPPCLTYSAQQADVAVGNQAAWTMWEGAGLHAQEHMGRSPCLADHQGFCHLCVP